MKENKGADLTTEQKIKEAAKKVFLERGFDGAKLKHIVEEAGVNLALVNYYFRSKEQLYKTIFMEASSLFFQTIYGLMNEDTPLEVKIWKLTDRYTDFLIENPFLPSFIMSEMMKSGGVLLTDMKLPDALRTVRLVQQLREEGENGSIRQVDPIQLVSILIGSILFPFIGRPVISRIGDMDDAAYRQFLESRKSMIYEMVLNYLRLR